VQTCCIVALNRPFHSGIDVIKTCRVLFPRTLKRLLVKDKSAPSMEEAAPDN
jgi:hypothetical protein